MGNLSKGLGEDLKEQGVSIEGSSGVEVNYGPYYKGTEERCQRIKDGAY